MAAILTDNGSTVTISENILGGPTRVTYQTADLHAREITTATGSTLEIFAEDDLIITLSNISGAIGFGNTAYGTTDPVVAHGALKISVGSVPAVALPAGAATELTQSTLLTQGTVITGESIPSGNGFLGWASSLRLAIKAIQLVLPTALVGGQLSVDTTGSNITANAGTNLNTSTLALEAGNLAALLARTPVLGQSTSIGSSPVVLPSAQISVLTPIAGNLEVTQLLIKGKTDNIDVALSTRLKPTDTLAGVTAVGAITDALPTGTNTIGNTNQTLATAEFAKITDGTNTATIRAGSSAPALGDTALVVSVSGNSANLGGLVPNTTATRSGVAAGIFNTVLPTLTTGQMVPLQLSANSELIAAPYIGGAPIAGNQGAANAQTLRVVQGQLTTTQAGQINPAADTPLAVGARVRGLLFTNTSAIPVFVGVYATGAALTAASVPSNGYVIRVPAGATLDKGVADFGENGRLFGASVRVGLSSTMSTFTALTTPNLLLCSLNVEIV